MCLLQAHGTLRAGYLLKTFPLPTISNKERSELTAKAVTRKGWVGYLQIKDTWY